MKSQQKIDVAAYVWPAYTGKEPRTRIFWPEGIGEWETVKLAKTKTPRHVWPRVPLLGYRDEADPETMEEQIELATSHGVNVFAYDWYWYDERPFLEQCLDEGFLGAKNSKDMKFYLMWANHDANNLWDRRTSDDGKRNKYTTIWQGKVHPEVFRELAGRWIEKYFLLDQYYRVDGKPLISIYDGVNFLRNFGGSYEKAKDAMLWLSEEAKKHGLPGVHFQLIHHGTRNFNVSGCDAGEMTVSYDEMVQNLPFDSITHYQYCHFAPMKNPYGEVMKTVYAEWDRLKESSPVPYYPHVSLGWDNNPRFPETVLENVIVDNTPANIETALRRAKELAEESGVPMVTINSWNEWTEGSYLLPDDLNGYGYLDAVRKVFVDNE